jgi:hypothetical protein
MLARHFACHTATLEAQRLTTNVGSCGTIATRYLLPCIFAMARVSCSDAKFTVHGIIALRSVNRLSRCKSSGHVLGDPVLKKWK